MSRTATKTTARPTKANIKPSARTKISVATLTASGAKAAKLDIPKWVDDNVAAIHGWTRAQGEGAASKDKKFKVVGVQPTRESTTGKPSKLSTYWRMTTADDKWENDQSIIYIADVSVKSFLDAFPGRYAESEDVEEDQVIPIWISGPRDGVIRNLVHQKILPSPGADVVAYQDQLDNWINSVAITYDNAPANEVFINELAENDEKFVKKSDTEEVAIDLKRIRGIEFVASLLNPARQAQVKVIDVNGGFIGSFGGKIEKNVNNIFTDYILDRIERDSIEFGLMSLDITGLVDKSGRIVKRTEVSRESITESNYGTKKRRPIDVSITVFVEGAETAVIIPRYALSTSEPEAVAALFAEIKAVNGNNQAGVTFEVDGDQTEAQARVTKLIATVRAPKTSKKTQQETELKEGLLYK